MSDHFQLTQWVWMLVWLVWTPWCAIIFARDLQRGRVEWHVVRDIWNVKDDPVFYWYKIAKRVGGVLLGLTMLWIGTQIWTW